MTKVTAGQIRDLAFSVLTRQGARDVVAHSVAMAIARAEAEGNPVCGLFYLPVFASHLRNGKVDGQVAPNVTVEGGAVRVDARHGFAHPAIEAGHADLIRAAQTLGVAAMTVTNSYNSLALSHHILPLVAEGLIALCVSNAHAVVAPPGASRPLFGTNPIAFAVPAEPRPIIVDQSLSAVTLTAVKMKAAAGEPIPLGWAQDAEGQPTTDAAAGLAGAILPSGGQKGANLSLLVELLAAALPGAMLSTQTTSLSNDLGGPPGIGQFLLALDPRKFGGDGFHRQIAALASSFEEAGARLPGSRSRPGAIDAVNVDVPSDLWERCRAL